MQLPQLTTSLMSLSMYNMEAVKDVIDTYHHEVCMCVCVCVFAG